MTTATLNERTGMSTGTTRPAQAIEPWAPQRESARQPGKPWPPTDLAPRFKAALPVLQRELERAEAEWAEAQQIGRGTLDARFSKELYDRLTIARVDCDSCQTVLAGLANLGCLHWHDDRAPCSCPGGKHEDQRKRA